MIIAVVGCAVCIAVAVGIPALAVVTTRFLKFKERELALEAEYRQKSQQQESALEQRVQRLEQTLASLDHDVRVKLEIKSSDQPLLEAPPDLARTRAR